VPCPRRKRLHRSPRHSSPGLSSSLRTEPPSPRQPVLAGSASRHVITAWEKSAGTTPAPRPIRRNGPADTRRRRQWHARGRLPARRGGRRSRSLSRMGTPSTSVSEQEKTSRFGRRLHHQQGQTWFARQ
jgi:hypothetical protein